MSAMNQLQFGELWESREHLNTMNIKLADEEIKALLIRLIDEVMELRGRVSELEQKGNWRKD